MGTGNGIHIAQGAIHGCFWVKRDEDGKQGLGSVHEEGLADYPMERTLERQTDAASNIIDKFLIELGHLERYRKFPDKHLYFGWELWEAGELCCSHFDMSSVEGQS